MQIQYELHNYTKNKANIWKPYMKFEANKEFMENLSLHLRLRLLMILVNSIQFYSRFYKIFTLYIVRQEYTNKGEEEGKKEN